MRGMRSHVTPLRLLLGCFLLVLVLLVPIAGSRWSLQNAHASAQGVSGLPRAKSATSLFGQASGKHAQRLLPHSYIPGRQLPGLAGHASQSSPRTGLTAHSIKANTTLASNVVVSSDNTPAPFGPEPRNGPQAAVDPTNANRLVVAFNDYTPNGHGSDYSAGYTTSTDNGKNWASSQLVHGLLKIDGGSYDGASDPAIAFDASGNSYLATTTFNNDDWATGVFVSKMSPGGTDFATARKSVSYNDTHHVIEYARLTTSGNNLYLTYNALSATPQAPNSTLAASWTSQLYFTRSSDGGATWSSPVVISAGPQDYWGVPVVTANNSILVVYTGAAQLKLVSSNDGGLTWSTPACLSAQNSCQSVSTVGEQRGLNEIYTNPGPEAIVDGNSLYVVYDGGKFTLSQDNGATWSKPLDVLGSSYEPAYLAAIGVDHATHTISIGGYSSANDSSQNSYNYYYAQSSDGGYHFSNPILVSTNISFPPAPAFGSIGRTSSIASAAGQAHLFWTDTNGTGGNEQIISAAVNLNAPLLGALNSTWDSGQSLPPWGLIFTGSGSQNIGVANYGQGGPSGIGTVHATTSGGSWLSATVSSTSNAYQVTVSVTAGANNQNGSVTITSDSGQNNSITLPVQLLVAPSSPTYSMSPATLSFTALQGVDPPPQGVQITNLTNANTSLSLSTNSDTALYVNSATGPANVALSTGVPSGFIVQVLTSGLGIGSSTHLVTVSDGTTSVLLNVTITITSAPAQLDDPGSALSFNYHLQAGPAPQFQTLTLKNSGGSTLHWQGQVDVPWLVVTPLSATLAAGASQLLSVGVSISGISQTGTLIGHIILGGDVQALNLPEIITVYFVISPSTAQISKTWYFAEGYVSANFSEYLTLENSNSQAATVSVTYLTQPVNQSPQQPFILTYTVKPNSRYTVWINNQPGIVQNDQISMIVNSNIAIVAERPIYFNYTQLLPHPSGGTDVVGATHQGSIFFFPYVPFGNDQQSGSPTFGSSYITYLTVLNQNNTPANVSITYEGAGSLYTVTHSVAANTRGTISLADDFPLARSPNSNSYLYVESLLITVDVPVVVELPSYFTIPNNNTHIAFASGTDEVGATAPQLSWDFAEGFTGTNNNQFLTYLDLANAGDTPANTTLTLAVTNGLNPLPTVQKQYTVPPQSSISVELNSLVCPQSTPYCGYAVGAHVSSTMPVVVDRQIFFNYQSTIPGATAVVGSAGPQTQFYFAEGYTGPGFTEYLTIVNPSTNSGAETVTIRYLIQGSSPLTVTLPHPLNPGQRWTEIVNNDVGANQQLAVVVTTNTGTLIVERPMYFIYHSLSRGGSDVIGYSQGN